MPSATDPWIQPTASFRAANTKTCLHQNLCQHGAHRHGAPQAGSQQKPSVQMH